MAKSDLKARKRAKSKKKGHSEVDHSLMKDARGVRLSRKPQPVWKVLHLDAGKLGIECPWNSCRGKAVVNKKKWLMQQPDFVTRVCTYCYNLSNIPQDILPKGDARKD